MYLLLRKASALTLVQPSAFARFAAALTLSERRLSRSSSDKCSCADFSQQQPILLHGDIPGNPCFAATSTLVAANERGATRPTTTTTKRTNNGKSNDKADWMSNTEYDSYTCPDNAPNDFETDCSGGAPQTVPGVAGQQFGSRYKKGVH